LLTRVVDMSYFNNTWGLKEFKVELKKDTKGTRMCKECHYVTGPSSVSAPTSNHVSFPLMQEDYLYTYTHHCL